MAKHRLKINRSLQGQRGKGVKIDKKKKAKIMKNPPAGGPKPWRQKEHDQFMKESGMTEEEHKEWHEKHGGWYGKDQDKEG